MVLSTFSLVVAATAVLILLGVLIRRGSWRLTTTVVVIALSAVAWMVRDGRERTKHRRSISSGAGAPPSLAEMSDFIPAQESADGYVTSQACVECHKHQHDTW